MNPSIGAELELALPQIGRFQVRGKSERARNPIVGTSTTSDPTSAFRPRAQLAGDKLVTPPDQCDFCLGRNLPAFLRVEDGEVIIGGEEFDAAVERGDKWVAENGHVTRENVAGLLDAFRRDHLMSATASITVIPNLMPLPGLGDTDLQNVFVTIANSKFHDCEDFADCPPDVFAAMIQASAVIGAYFKPAITAPYINGGRNRLSGATIAHPHGQIGVTGLPTNSTIPHLYGKLLGAKRLGACRICQLVQMRELHIDGTEASNLILMAHPAPEYSFSLLILARDCLDDLSQVDGLEFARLYIRAISTLKAILGSTLAYNLAIRVGAGHLHAEIVPRSSVNIKAGAEIAFQESFVDVPPSQVVRAINQTILREQEKPR